MIASYTRTNSDFSSNLWCAYDHDIAATTHVPLSLASFVLVFGLLLSRIMQISSPRANKKRQNELFRVM